MVSKLFVSWQSEKSWKLCDNILIMKAIIQTERWPSWSKAHAWKVCVLQKGTKGSNPFLSAEYIKYIFDNEESSFAPPWRKYMEQGE